MTNNCVICGISCSDKISIRQDMEQCLNSEKPKGIMNVFYFCSKTHQYLWDIGSHALFYNSSEAIINHLIKLHGYDIVTLERALNLYLKGGEKKISTTLYADSIEELVALLIEQRVFGEYKNTKIKYQRKKQGRPRKDGL